jgi:hypothetical protein
LRNLVKIVELSGVNGWFLDANKTIEGERIYYLFSVFQLLKYPSVFGSFESLQDSKPGIQNPDSAGSHQILFKSFPSSSPSQPTQSHTGDYLKAFPFHSNFNSNFLDAVNSV